jgi:hypothetical protein
VVRKIKMKWKHVFVIGVGGTGSHLIGPLVQLMSNHAEGTTDITIIDGDDYEEDNAIRQVFEKEAVGKNKARATAERLGGGSIKAVAQFIDKEKFTKILETTIENKDDEFLVIPCVDNHATRKAILEALDEGDYTNFIWASPGNTFDTGQLVLYIKEEGEALTTHPVAKYPDLADPADAIPAADGCLRHINSTPQLITANYLAAGATLATISNILDEKGWYEEMHFNCRKVKMVPQGTLKGVLV